METRNITISLLIITFLSLIFESYCQYRPGPGQYRPSPALPGQYRPSPTLPGQYRPSPTLPYPSFPALRPLCISQFALVNHACSMLPYSPVTPPPPPPPSAPNSPGVAAPSPPSDSHRHRHHHKHKHISSPDPAVEECCRWLKEVDTQCVCDLLVRLPVFLAKPVHAYTVEVDPDCSVTYTCPGRVIMT
ncbi:hypothetical protein RND81_05G192300 [Saponaria officinalis]|uniref:Bifunctional inhibitor/plant lipid transfer protein/seed storage helical domain-containing protein n=1 Tax=Saponaria officinalis TaxID=3572 RepID=A0AAW1KZY8_SAPOF